MARFFKPKGAMTFCIFSSEDLPNVLASGKVVKSSDMKGGGGGESKNFNVNFQVTTLDASDFNSQLVNSRETIHNLMMRMDRQSGRSR